jgi:hypothetical protein
LDLFALTYDIKFGGLPVWKQDFVAQKKEIVRLVVGSDELCLVIADRQNSSVKSSDNMHGSHQSVTDQLVLFAVCDNIDLQRGDEIRA